MSMPASWSPANAGRWRETPGFPWRFEKTPAAVRLAAPRFAEHNGGVFRGLLGLSEAEVAALYANGVTSDAPIYASGPGL